ncbi:Uncharacterized membrane protein, DUF485 family [Nocardioides scoriae]|uniref:Uncharacterized membrane protein, DUF485 family n=1 Tax=Nocardioides scoriae TaxID=642780 RepID=A0A1H1UF43_9ACTN|nr:DUF485 domain-containing protein [Nocardioides scoriae]SDS70796.1 Uncharacterized membrane protein, DUF485 family [Nocardioides scoriae]
MTETDAAAQAARHDPVYDRLHETAEFAELRRRYRGFVFPATAAFLVWYLLYVVLSNWAPGFMGAKLFGNINVALVFGLLQFVTTFLLAYLYSSYSNRKLDPLARQLNEEYERGRRGGSDEREARA